MKIKSITTGFLSGNLNADGNIDLDATCLSYARECEHALKNRWPDADVSVDWQDAIGVLPSPLQTAVELVDDAGEQSFDCAEEESTIRQVDDICADVFERGEFWVMEAAQ